MRKTSNELVFLGFVVLATALLTVLFMSAARADGHQLTVDGVTYSPTKVVGSGPTVHYETPDTDPQEAFSERHTWTGNGSENLPCEGGIHWIDNKNVLTISHCLEVVTTSTTMQATTTTAPGQESTTTVVSTETTVTTVAPTTSTTAENPSTTVSEEITTTTGGPTTTVTSSEELPYTGSGTAALVVLGTALLIGGGTALVRERLRVG